MDIQTRLQNKYSEHISQLWIYETKKGLELSHIEIKPESRGKGIANQIMQDLVDYADENELTIGATPSSDFGGSKSKIIEWNKKFGFVMNKGRNKDFSFKNTMIRYPQMLKGGAITESENFKKWFGDSKMVDKNGLPNIYYHGTGALGTFNVFDKSFITATSGNAGHFGEGFYFTDTFKKAKSFSEFFGGSGDVIEVYLKIENPFYVNESNLIKLGEKYELNLPTKKDMAIDIDDLLRQLKQKDQIAYELLASIHKHKDYSKGWEEFMQKHKGDIPKSEINLDLNTVADWYEDTVYEKYSRGISEITINELKEIGIKPKIIKGYDEDIRMDYLTNLGQSSGMWTDAIKADGHDGIVAGEEIVVFEPNQIKLADGTNVTFDPKNPSRNPLVELSEPISMNMQYSQIEKIVNAVKSALSLAENVEQNWRRMSEEDQQEIRDKEKKNIGEMNWLAFHETTGSTDLAGYMRRLQNIFIDDVEDINVVQTYQEYIKNAEGQDLDINDIDSIIATVTAEYEDLKRKVSDEDAFKAELRADWVVAIEKRKEVSDGSIGALVESMKPSLELLRLRTEEQRELIAAGKR